MSKERSTISKYPYAALSSLFSLLLPWLCLTEDLKASKLKDHSAKW